MASVDQMLAVCQAELGYREGPGRNVNKYAALAGHANGQPWCATFLCAMARRVGLTVPNTAGTVLMLQMFRQQRRVSSTPSRGAFAFFDFPDRIRRVQHVGIVESWTQTTVTCIEGNTSGSWFGSQSNGGGVYRKTRPLRHVVAFGVPAYTFSPTPATPAPVPTPPASSEVPELDANERQTLQQAHDAVASMNVRIQWLENLLGEIYQKVTGKPAPPQPR